MTCWYGGSPTEANFPKRPKHGPNFVFQLEIGHCFMKLSLVIPCKSLLSLLPQYPVNTAEKNTELLHSICSPLHMFNPCFPGHSYFVNKQTFVLHKYPSRKFFLLAQKSTEVEKKSWLLLFPLGSNYT